MKKLILYFWAITFLTVSVSAFWSPTPVAKLSEISSEVVMGKVVELKPNLNVRRVVVTMEVTQLLKGTHKDKTITFKAPFSLIDDVEVFPLSEEPSSYEVGQNCLVFLKKMEKGFRMTMYNDGKYLLDKEMKNYKYEIISNDKWKPVADVIKQIK